MHPKKLTTAMLASMVAIGCGGSPTSPTTPAPTPPATTTPSAVATPVPTPNPNTSGGLTVTYSAGACFSVTNPFTIAIELTSWYTSFDNPHAPLDPQRKPHLAPGASWGHCYNLACIQVDVDQPGVKELGGYWFDVNQRPFDASKEPSKIAACRAVVPVVEPTPEPTPIPTPEPRVVCIPPPPCREDGPPCPLPWPTPCPKEQK